MAKLEDIVKNITSGGTPYTQNDKFYDGDIPWLRTQEVNFNFIEDTEIKITPEGLKNSSAKWIPENSVIIAMYGNSAGRVAYSKIPLTTNQACCNITVDEKKADSLFLYYYLVKNYSNLEKLANGGAQQNLNVGIIKDFPFPNTPLSSQHRIANILSSFDNKIELLRKENNTLEDIAQSIFKEWFVKYNFPNKDCKPYRDNNGKMIDSELGLIPEGWRVGKLGEVVNNKRTITVPASTPKDRYLHYSIPAFDKEQQPSYDLGETILSNKFVIENPCILVSKLNPRIPRIWVILKVQPNSICSTEFQIIEPIREELFPYVIGVLGSDKFSNFLISAAKGTSSSHQRVNTQDILEYQVCLPDIDIQKLHSQLISPITLQYDNNKDAIQNLLKQKLILLSKLII